MTKAETSAQPPAWQFLQDGKWHIGMNTNDHRRHTEAAGYPTRDLWPINYHAHAEALAEALEMMVEMVEFGGFGKDAAMDTARAALAAFDQDMEVNNG